MVFLREGYTARLIEEMIPLWKSHDQEVPGPAGMPLDPDLRVYEQMHLAGMLRIFTVRSSEGKLQGYQVMMVSKHPHSQKCLQAVQDILYIAPEARKGLTGYKFIQWCCARLKDEGVRYVCQYISARNDFGPLLERAGYELSDLAFTRRLS